MASTENVFTYGSLMFPQVWQRVVRGSYTSSIATIHGFRRVCVLNGAHPSLIIARRAPPIQGRLYFSIDATDIARLDYFETSAYERVLVSATVGTSSLHAQAYIGLDTARLLDRDWSETAFAQAGLPMFLSTYAVDNAPPE